MKVAIVRDVAGALRQRVHFGTRPRGALDVRAFCFSIASITFESTSSGGTREGAGGVMHLTQIGTIAQPPCLRQRRGAIGIGFSRIQFPAHQETKTTPSSGEAPFSNSILSGFAAPISTISSGVSAF